MVVLQHARKLRVDRLDLALQGARGAERRDEELREALERAFEVRRRDLKVVVGVLLLAVVRWVVSCGGGLVVMVG